MDCRSLNENPAHRTRGDTQGDANCKVRSEAKAVDAELRETLLDKVGVDVRAVRKITDTLKLSQGQLFTEAKQQIRHDQRTENPDGAEWQRDREGGEGDAEPARTPPLPSKIHPPNAV